MTKKTRRIVGVSIGGHLMTESDEAPVCGQSAPDMKADLEGAAQCMEWIAARLKEPVGDDIATSVQQLQSRAKHIRALLAKAGGR